jgi:CHAT domain-containing protein/tetratricopeptide (TPR) repeat protein
MSDAAKRQSIAESLVGESSRKKLRERLGALSTASTAALSRDLKELAYAAWTSHPNRVRRAASVLTLLSELHPAPEITAFRDWISAIAEITRGRLSAAVELLESSSRRFHAAGMRPESAQPKVAELMVLSMLGRNEEAIGIGRDALSIFRRYRDQLAAGKVEMNLSNILSRLERHSESISLCRSAIRRFEKLGESHWLVMAQNDLAISHFQLNDLPAAEKYFALALKGARAAEMVLTQAEIEANMGNLARIRGAYSEALRLMESSRRLYEQLDMPHETARADLEIADIYTEVNLTTEACEIYERTVKRLTQLRMRREEAWARGNWARTLERTGSYAAARREFRRAKSLFTAQSNYPAASYIMLDMAELELRAGKAIVALSLQDEARRSLNSKEHARALMKAELVTAEARWRSAENVDTRSRLATLAKKAVLSGYKSFAQAAFDLSGRIAYELGDIPAAKKSFEKAAELIESTREDLSSDEFRRVFIGSNIRPFEFLLRISLELGRIEDAFDHLSRSRSRALLDAVHRKGTKTKSDPSSDRYVQKAADLRRELNWLYHRTANVGDADAGITARVRRTEKDLAEASRRVEAYSGPVRSAASTNIGLHAIRETLGSRRAIVEYFELDGIISAFVITDQAIRHVSRLTAASDVMEKLEGLRFQFEALRYGKDLSPLIRSAISTRINARLKELRSTLIEPVADLIADRDLIVIPSGPLNYVPFAALYDGRRYLIEERELTTAPSSALWHSLASRPRRKPKNSLLIGFLDESIPLVDEEIKRIAKVVPTPTVFDGAAATFSNYLHEAPRHDLLHIACHGQFRADNPMFSSLHLADGWITVADILSQRLDAGLVTLSACETGINRVHPGDEILGLVRGFLAAGARSLVVSLWRIDDKATLGLMTNFYESMQRGQDVPASLRIAQIASIRRGDSPFYWSPFTVIGA